MGTLPAETVLVVFLPATFHTPQERQALQQKLLREIGHGTPASDTIPLRNVTLDFFEAVMATPSNIPLTSQYHMQRQQASGFYHYYSAVQPFIPFQAFASHLQVANVEITGAVIIERQFDLICKCAPIQPTSHVQLSALALRTASQTKLPS